MMYGYYAFMLKLLKGRGDRWNWIVLKYIDTEGKQLVDMVTSKPLEMWKA